MVIVPWCNGSTPDFGSVSLGSNPGGTTTKNANNQIIRLLAFLFKGKSPENPHLIKYKEKAPQKPLFLEVL